MGSTETTKPIGGIDTLPRLPGKPLPGFYFQWHFLECCNLRCKHCYQQEYQAKSLPVSDLLRIAQNIESALARWKHVGRVSLTGGEPLMQPDVLFRLLDYLEASSHFNWVGILTNGTLITPEIAEGLARYSKLREVQVSLDGSTSAVHDSTRGNGSFNKAIRGITLLRESGINTAVMFTLTKRNVDDALNMIDYAIDLGVNALTIERATPTGLQFEITDSIAPGLLMEVYTKIDIRKKALGKESQLKLRTSRPLWCLVDSNSGGFCPVGYSCLSILHDGTVLPCRRLEIPLGNVLTDGIFRIWYTSPILWKLRNKQLLHNSCRTCSLLANCGGCRAAAYATSGDYMGADPQCWISQLQQTPKP